MTVSPTATQALKVLRTQLAALERALERAQRAHTLRADNAMALAPQDEPFGAHASDANQVAVGGALSFCCTASLPLVGVSTVMERGASAE